MCTCILLNKEGSYFGRNMDIHYSFNEKIIFVPKRTNIKTKRYKDINIKFSILGIGTIINDYPFYADAMNEKGLAIAGLNFLNNAHYFEYMEDKINITPYELPLFILGNCSNIDEVKEIIENINLLKEPFSSKIPLAYLHFMISDKDKSIVIEQTKEGLKIYDNELNVLTNNPEFLCHKNNLYNYSNLSIEDPSNGIGIISYGQGLIGLPGDYSSMSRFIKIYFIKENILLDSRSSSIDQFFYCLDAVLMPIGLVKVQDKYEYTRYSSCYDLINKEMYYKTYISRRINKVKFDFTSSKIQSIDL